jgi:hypothetical protein
MTLSLAGIPKIPSGLDLVKRFEASILLNGLISGERAHAILLEVVRRVAADRPPDTQAAFDRLHDLQTYLNNTTTPGIVPLTVAELVLAFEASKAAVLAAAPQRAIAGWGTRTKQRVPNGEAGKRRV